MDLFQSIIPTLSNFVGLKSNNDEINNNNKNNSTSDIDIEMSTADIAINYKNRIIESIQNDESYIRRKPVSLYIKNLSIKLKGNSNNNIKDKIVVHPFTAFIEGGSLFCILGGSGSGKTTLLNIIAKRYDKKNVIVDGKISYKINNNNNNNYYYSNNNIGYVTQNDYLLPYLTVRETLIFIAKLKMSKDQNIISKRNEIVNQVIMDLGLKEVADSLIGENEWKRGLSGGEKRRVSIAIQIISNPSILCLDEITSGLDSFTALTVTESLLRLSKGNRKTTVICSVHQPRSDLFYIFDSVLLLSRGGQSVYCGKILNMIKYFSNIGYSCPSQSNPADYFVDLASIDIRNIKNTKLDKMRVEKLIYESFQQENFHLNQAQVLFTEEEDDDECNDININNDIENHTSWFYQVFVLLYRFSINNWRDSSNIFGGIIQAFIMGLIIMGIFWNMGDDNQSAIRSRYGLSYIIISAEPYILMIILVQKYCVDLKIFDRELLDHLYKPSAYLTAHFLSTFPQLFIQPFMYGLPIYYGCNMRSGYKHLLIYLAVNILISFIINGIAWMSVSLQRNFSVASLIANMNFTFIGLTSGFLVNFKELPIYVKWVKYISYHSYSYKILMSNEFSDRIFNGCLSENPSDCILFNGNFLLSQNNVKVNDYHSTWPVLFAMIIVYHLIAYINLNFILQPPVGSISLSADDLEDDYIDFENIKLDDVNLKHKETSQGYEMISSHADGVKITLDNIHLSVSVKQEFSSQFIEKKLLSNIYASIEPNRLVALMGGSGSGKSTLMNLIAGRISMKQSSKIFRLLSNDTVYSGSGKILFNGVVPTGEQIRQMIGYMQQNDFHIPSLTVKETLMFHASLRLSNKLSNDEKKRKVMNVIEMLGLKECSNTKVGNEEVKGVSGGEKRRLSLGVQMLTDPKVCLIDEVTTGLDAFTARSVVETLKEISRNGRTIILAIHQPRYDVFALLDDIILLSRGKQVWSGDAATMITHFKHLSYVCPLLTNPGDFILDLSSVDFRTTASEEESQTRLNILVNAFSTVIQGNENSLESISKDDNNTLAVSIISNKENPLSLTLPLLLSRSILNQIRQPALGITRVQQGLSFALILSCFYAPVQDNQNSIQNRIGNLYMMTSLCFIGMLNCIAVFPIERNVFYREYLDGGYTALAFFLSYLIISIPFLIISAVMLSVLMTFAIGLKATGEAFLIFSYVVFTFLYVGEMIGISYLALFYHVGFSVNIMSVFISFFCMMAGFISIKMSLVLETINFISPLKYGAYILTNTIFKDVHFKCDDNEKLSNGNCAISTGEEVLKLYKMYDKSSDKFITNVWVLGLLCFIYTIIAYIVVRYRVYKISH